MNTTLFLILFSICEVVTPLITEGVKTLLKGVDKKYNATILALIVSIVVSGICVIFAYINQNIAFNTTNIFYIVFLMCANWLGATLGYDKVMQALSKVSK